MQWPHMMAFTINKKLLSMRMISEASFTTSVPAMPIEKLTSAILSTGPSFMPSPVMPTILPRNQRVLTRMFLSSGEEQAKTWRHRTTSIQSFGSRSQNTGPSMIMPPAVYIPHWVAIDLAVRVLSPVHILTVTPAWWQEATASHTLGQRGSSMLVMATSVIL